MEEAWRRCRGKYLGNGLLEISYPVYDSLPIAKTYVGVKGALSLAEDYIHLVRRMNKTKGVTFEISEFAAGINTIDAITTGQLDIGNFADYAGINRIA